MEGSAKHGGVRLCRESFLTHWSADTLQVLSDALFNLVNWPPAKSW